MKNGGTPSSPADLERMALEALASGRALMDSILRLEESDGLKPFPLASPDGHLAEMSGFFVGTSEGFTSPAMGCLQRAVFRLRAPLVSDDLKCLPQRFARLCGFTDRNGAKRGFSYAPLLCCETGSGFSKPAHPGAVVDFSLEGLDWLLVRVDIHDFVRAAVPFRPLRSPLSRIFREAALVVAHRDYSRTGKPQGESLCRQSFGYSFLPVAPEPNIFGFGPGHFGTAVKRFVFKLLPTDRIEMELLFAVSPRSEKVFNFGGFDPIYGAVDILEALTFRRLGIKSRVHDWFDARMLRMHGQVHHNLLLDMRELWEQGRWNQ